MRPLLVFLLIVTSLFLIGLSGWMIPFSSDPDSPLSNAIRLVTVPITVSGFVLFPVGCVEIIKWLYQPPNNR